MSTSARAKPQAEIIFAPLDLPLVLSVGLLLTVGLIMVYSSSSVFAQRLVGDSEHFIRHQLLHAFVGVAAMIGISRLSLAWLSRRAGWFFVGTVTLLTLVLIPGLGAFRGGARRWLDLGPLGFQPSEFAKVALVIVLAAILARREARSTKERPSLLLPVLIAQIPIALVLMEPDLGAALVMELMLAAMVFVAGLRTRTLVALGLCALPVFYHLVVGTPFRLRRMLGYIDPWAYRDTVGYQVTEALISIGSGGVTGLGLGEGNQQLFFLPEAHSDFIFAILGQELGLVGILTVLMAYGVLIWRGTLIALAARLPFERYLAMGVTAIVGVPAVFNTMVVTGLLPTKGLSLPFVSYGGSNLVATLIAVGLLLRVQQSIPSETAKDNP